VTSPSSLSFHEKITKKSRKNQQWRKEGGTRKFKKKFSKNFEKKFQDTFGATWTEAGRRMRELAEKTRKNRLAGED